MIFKIDIFGDETWDSDKKIQKYTRFLPQGDQIELIFTLWAAVSEIQTD